MLTLIRGASPRGEFPDRAWHSAELSESAKAGDRRPYQAMALKDHALCSSGILIPPDHRSIFTQANMVKAPPAISVDRMFRAFSDRTRLRILNLLRSGELCVCDLVRVIGAPQPKISRHLAYLRKARLVTARKEGLWMHYKLAAAKNDFHRKLLECLECCFTSDVPELSRDMKTLGKVCCDGPKCCD